jgi:nucleoside 2-deoxyribosyltransferase
MIRSSDVLVADVSDQDPAVMLDAGMAVASGVPMVLLTREGDVPVDLGGERVVRYSMSDEGLDRLRTRLAEVLREMAIRSESR